jgi:hypothetical protein
MPVLLPSARARLPQSAQAGHAHDFAGAFKQVVLDEFAIAKAPSSVSLVKSATLPLNGLTADRSLDMIGLHRGETLLVTGAAQRAGSRPGAERAPVGVQQAREEAHCLPADVEHGTVCDNGSHAKLLTGQQTLYRNNRPAVS